MLRTSHSLYLKQICAKSASICVKVKNEKQSQIASIKLEILIPKFEILNKNEKTKPI